MDIDKKTMSFTILHLFCGSGGAALGFQQSRKLYRGIEGKFLTIAGIDNDPLCCQDFERLTGAPAVCLDLFTREQYIRFWGKEPPEGWQEITPEDIRKSCNGIYPDVIFLSPPCKGFSGLLPEKSAKTEKYQALNGLVEHSIHLVMAAFTDHPPAVIMIENVPRITSRGAKLLNGVKGLLKSFGFKIHDGSHDCGELGGLGQIRKRYLLIARNPKKLPSFIMQPVKQKLKSIGEVIGKLPPPGDVKRAGAMHRIPRLAWKTWVRLALIPAGGDWRDLNRNCYANLYRIVPWDMTSGTITGAYGVNNGAISVADTRVSNNIQRYPGKWKLEDWIKPSSTILGQTDIQCGAASINDPRLGYTPRSGAYRVVRIDESSPTITASMGAGRSNGISAIADPYVKRVQGADAKYRVIIANETSSVVTGKSIDNGVMISGEEIKYCKARAGTMGVMSWECPGKTILGSSDVHAGSAALADPRIPEQNEQGIFVIIAEDGTWHRPLTTYEMAMLQDLPATWPDGSPLVLAGNSEARWREHIGNLIPPSSACAIGNALLDTMMPNYMGEWFWGFSTDEIWVKQEIESIVNYNELF